VNKRYLSAVAVLAALLLCVTAPTTCARKLEVRNSANGFRINWRPLRIEAAGINILCPLQLEGSFERSSYAKVAGAGIGRVTGVSITGRCESGTATFLRETLPWEVTYKSFGGALPDITSLTLNFLRLSWQLEAAGTRCLARTETNRPFRGIATVEPSGAITGFRADETAAIETTGGLLCSFAGPGHFGGLAERITNQAGTGAITIRLI
jgi:hypothetical protein